MYVFLIVSWPMAMMMTLWRSDLVCFIQATVKNSTLSLCLFLLNFVVIFRWYTVTSLYTFRDVMYWYSIVPYAFCSALQTEHRWSNTQWCSLCSALMGIGAYPVIKLWRGVKVNVRAKRRRAMNQSSNRGVMGLV